MTLRKLTADDVRIFIHVHPEDDDPAGHFATGDDALDAEIVAKINRDLDAGNLWAWCAVEVEVRWNGFSDSTYRLGCCSYKDEDDFKQGGYYEDMLAEALDQLNRGIAHVDAQLAPLRIP